MKTAIIVRDKEQMIEVDRVLEMGGFKIEFHTLGGHLRLITEDGGIQHIDHFGIYQAIHLVSTQGYTFMTADEFLETPGLLDGWGKSAKKNVTMQEIAEKFGVEVKDLNITGE